MLDTVKFKLSPSPLKVAGPDWKVEKGTRIDDDGVRGWTSYSHKETALRIYGSEGFAGNIELSLPRLMHGSNGILLRPSEVNTAYFGALDLASTVVEDLLPEKLTRVDLVHHFHGWAFDFVASLKGLKHTAVRKKQIEFFESGLEWPGKNMRIRLYDKKAEMCNQPGMIQRLEAQLRNNKLDNVVWSPRSGFDVANLYEIYKAVCSGFSSRKIPRISSIEELLYLLKSNEVKIEGYCPVERYMSGRGRTSRYRIQKALNGLSLDFFEASFLSHLPDNINDLTFLDCIPDAVPISPEAPLRGVGEAAA